MSKAGATTEKKRGPRLPFGELRGLWYELPDINRGLKLKTIPADEIDRARARVFALSTMMGLVDRILEERKTEALETQIAELRAAIAGGAVVSSPGLLTAGTDA